MIEIDGFEEFHPIGVGSFGDVYSAWDKTRHRLVAIKVLRSELADDPDHRDRFVREGERLADLDHSDAADALVDIISFGDVDGRPYLVMSYADRGTLGERGPMIADAARTERLELAERLIASLNKALSVVHDNGLIHRDVKPSNIMFHSTSDIPAESDSQDNLIGPDEAMVLGDFGLATSYIDPTTVRVMPAGVGTPGYVPPEATNPEIGWLPQSDLYSATVVVVFALTAKPAEGPWQQRLEEAGYGDQILTQIKKGLNENLTERHANINQWATELLAAINHTRAHEPSTDRKRKRLLIPAIAAVVGIATVGLLAVLSGAIRNPNPKTANENPQDTETRDEAAGPIQTREESSDEEIVSETAGAETQAVTDFDCTITTEELDQLADTETITTPFGDANGEFCDELVFLKGEALPKEQPWSQIISYCVINIEEPDLTLWLQISEPEAGWTQLTNDKSFLGPHIPNDTYQLYPEPELAGTPITITYEQANNHIVGLRIQGTPTDKSSWLFSCKESWEQDDPDTAAITFN